MEKNKSNIVDFGAYRKKKGLESKAADQRPETDIAKSENPFAKITPIGKKASATAESEFSYFSRYIGTGETKNWWVKAGLQLELGMPLLMKKIERATQGKFSPKTLAENIKLVEEYTNEEIIEYLKNSDQKHWQQKPTFYRALLTVLHKRM
ncbi:hypothetical protein COX00_03960 [Candidatus Uhrbacteria bacterium CG22_combo_CG10-13_8_21_14_all_47_17]|uniref:Uncharacterized protein n=1 Tax=Candidatus Uhrbacteria bacterium CG22_combo_CG10-13_8_21_14_all_47_17 TaxID=1975041 RepID=A0A2H0BRL6_9BACT|nr:MAG: hypothetical protein COX00_03960 [Candidatus Uhrbacteria bacterium CG22_combo_CG10-13_8_21_14_all_47_17]